jgi:hypothetical protein
MIIVHPLPAQRYLSFCFVMNCIDLVLTSIEDTHMSYRIDLRYYQRYTDSESFGMIHPDLSASTSRRTICT